MWWLQLVVEVLGGLALLWLLLLFALWLVKPDEQHLREWLRLLPDVVRLLSRLARDRQVPWGMRLRLWGLLGYLVMPIDLIPDFVPVIGYADDAIVVAFVLRSVVRSAGRGKLDQHWPGTPSGLAAVERLARISGAAPPRDHASRG